VLWLLEIDTWLFFLLKFGHLHLWILGMYFLPSKLFLFVFDLAILASTFIIIVVVVIAIRKAHRHINLLFNHQCLSWILRCINIHLYMLTSFNFLLNGMELGRAWYTNIDIRLLITIWEAFVGNTVTGIVYDLNGLMVVCVIFGFTVILILH